MFNLWKNVEDVLFSFVFLSLLLNLLFKMLILGIYLVITGIPTKLCFMSVMCNICLKSFCKNLFCFIVRVGIRNS